MIKTSYQLKMTLIIATLGLIALAAFLLAIARIPFVYRAAEKYAYAQMDELYGSQSLSAEHRTFVEGIAQEMDIDTTPIVMRMLNTNGLRAYGYHNALAAFHIFFVLPIIDTPFLYISEGMFTELSVSEQRFLIGHELVHIKEEHLRYTPLLLQIFIIFLIYLLMYALQIIKRKTAHYRLAHIIQAVLILSLFTILFTGTKIVEYTYKRHCEWEADTISTAKLSTYDGGIKIMDRFVAQYGVPAENPLGNLFSDHPSSVERRAYFVASKKNIDTSDNKTA